MDVMKCPFARDFVRAAAMSFAQGWHERNGGNLSYRLTDADVAAAFCEGEGEGEGAFEDAGGELAGEWHDAGVCVPDLAGEYFMVTATGSYFQNIARDVAGNCGIIQLDASGTKWRTRWGFAGGGRPTSELSTHLLNHSVRSRVTGGASRVLHHAHPANIIALTFVLPLDSATFTRELWGAISECAIVFPAGVGVLPWGVPGSVELARASAREFERREAVIWPHHGIFCSGNNFDLAFGLLHTIEKAAEILVKVYSMGGPAKGGAGNLQRISNEGILQMAQTYNLPLDQTCL